MKGPKMRIELDYTKPFKPCQISTARQIPAHMEKMAKKLMEELETNRAVRRYDGYTPSVSPGHFVLKACAKKVRLVTDYRILNLFVKRPVRPFQSATDLMRRIHPDSKWFCKLDAIHGYFQIPLDEDSQLLTAFLLPDGKWVYTVAPMGLVSSSAEFCIRSDNAVAAFFEWLLKIVDDMAIQGKDLQTVFFRLRRVLDACRVAGIKLSLDKLKVGRSIKFAGFVIGSDGIHPDPAKLASLKHFPTPKTITELKSFLGLANQLGHFLPDLAQSTVHMRELLKKNTAFLWLSVHSDEFTRVRELLCSSGVVKPFDMSLPTQLLTDASRLFGLGFALVQVESGNPLRLIQCGSCSLSPAQKNYATVELEATAILWAVNKCDHYLRGISSFSVITDHKPLLGVFEKPLAAMANDRLQRIREKLLPYNFKLEWTAGKTHLIADALSRAPYFPADVSTEVSVFGIWEADPMLAGLRDGIDEDYRFLRETVRRGTEECPDRLSPFRPVWGDLRVEAGLVVMGERIVVPGPSRSGVLDSLHLSHSGITKTMAMARQQFFWPGMSNDVTQRVARCAPCRAQLPSLPMEPLAVDGAAFPCRKYPRTCSTCCLVQRFSSPLTALAGTRG